MSLDWLKKAYVMTMFVINSQACREISIKAENIWKAKKKKLSRKKMMRKHYMRIAAKNTLLKKQ